MRTFRVTNNKTCQTIYGFVIFTLVSSVVFTRFLLDRISRAELVEFSKSNSTFFANDKNNNRYLTESLFTFETEERLECAKYNTVRLGF